MGASIEFEFKGNLAQLRRDLGEAGRLAKASAADISRSTRDSFRTDAASLFRRTPERRAERAIAGLGAGLLTGDIGTAIGSFTEKITAFGLAAGAGVGIAITAFEKFRHEVQETDAAFDVLKRNLSQPLALERALGPEELTSRIDAGTKDLDAALKKRESIWTKLDEFLHRGTIGGQSDTRFGGARSADLGPDLAAQRDKIEADNLERLNRLASDRADKELQFANLKLKSVQGFEKEAALAKISLEAEEKKAALLLTRHGNALDLFKSGLAIDVEAQAARLQIEKKFPPPASQGPFLKNFTNASWADILPSLQGVSHEDRMKAIANSQANEDTVDKWRKRQADAMEQFRQNQQNEMDEYNQWRFGGVIRPGDQRQGGSDDIGTGTDGIKKGIDALNAKMDKYWS